MYTLDKVSCSDGYTDAASIKTVFDSSGGYLAVTGNDAYARLIYGKQGQQFTTAEFHVPIGNGILYPGTIGIEFRNYTAGSVAVVSGALSNAQEPPVALSAGGVATPSVTTTITGIIPATGTTPTAGSGFTYTHANGSGQYVFTFTTPFATAPTVLLTALLDAQIGIRGSNVTAAGFQVNIRDGAGAAFDAAFNFAALKTV